MRVDLAAQVLSGSVSKAIELTGGQETSETARFAGMVDKFFDAVNVHNFTHGKHSRKMFQIPYTSGEDMRLKWLESDFLGYLADWKDSVMERPGFSKTEKNRMLLRAETRLGLQITCKSFVELVRYLFTLPDVQSFLSQRICQDPLERFFGCQWRSMTTQMPRSLQRTLMQALRVIKSVWKTSARGN